MTLRYSICISNYNTRPSIEEALKRIVEQINQDFEIIVVDNYSRDGSVAILSKYAKAGQLKLILRHTTRGAAFQAALEKAHGSYVINMALDDLWRPTLQKLLSYYHAYHEGKAIFAKGVVIAPRQLLLSVGGWLDLQRGEDVDMMLKLARIGKCVMLPYNPCIERGVRKWTWIERLIDGYKGLRDVSRLGINPLRTLASTRNALWNTFRRYGFMGAAVSISMAVMARITFRLWPLLENPEAPFYDSFRNRITLTGRQLQVLQEYLAC